MKTTLNRMVIGSVLALGSLFSGTASAESVVGKINFLGTISEDYGPHARFRMRVARSTCGSGNATPMDRWIHVRSGVMDGYPHNSANFRNAYSTLLVAFVTGNRVQIDGVPSCNASDTQTIDLWVSNIAVF